MIISGVAAGKLFPPTFVFPVVLLLLATFMQTKISAVLWLSQFLIFLQ